MSSRRLLDAEVPYRTCDLNERKLATRRQRNRWAADPQEVQANVGEWPCAACLLVEWSLELDLRGCLAAKGTPARGPAPTSMGRGQEVSSSSCHKTWWRSGLKGVCGPGDFNGGREEDDLTLAELRMVCRLDAQRRAGGSASQQPVDAAVRLISNAATN